MGCLICKSNIEDNKKYCDVCKLLCPRCKINIRSGPRWPCKGCISTEMKTKRKENKSLLISRKCRKCSIEFEAKYLQYLCVECSIQESAKYWSRKSELYKTIRKSDSHRNKQKEYHQKNRKKSELSLLEMFGSGGQFCCQTCGFKSDVKRQFSLHHKDPEIKTISFTKILRSGTYSRKLIDKERVIFICENCHRMEHNKICPKRTKFFDDLSELGIIIRCQECLESSDLRVYEFHHVDPLHKNYHIKKRQSLKSQIDEVKKCALLCARCHRKIDENPGRYLNMKSIGDIISSGSNLV